MIVTDCFSKDYLDLCVNLGDILIRCTCMSNIPPLLSIVGQKNPHIPTRSAMIDRI